MKHSSVCPLAALRQGFGIRGQGRMLPLRCPYAKHGQKNKPAAYLLSRWPIMLYMVNGAGLEPDSSQNEGQSHPGRSLTDSGRETSQLGRSQELAQGPPVNEGTLQALTPTQPRTLSEHNMSITENAVNSELQTVIEGWLRLPGEFRAGIVAMVKAFEPRQKP